MIKVSIAPATEPITLAEAKLHCKVDATADDDLISALIVAARQFVETGASLRLITQTIQDNRNEFPGDGIIFLEGPVQSVSEITYLDTDNDSQTHDLTLTTLDISSNPARLVPAYEESWPDSTSHLNSIAITYVAGFGAAAAVPQLLRQAIFMLVAHWYANRESTAPDPVYEVPLAVDSIVKMFSRGIIL